MFQTFFCILFSNQWCPSWEGGVMSPAGSSAIIKERDKNRVGIVGQYGSGIKKIVTLCRKQHERPEQQLLLSRPPSSEGSTAASSRSEERVAMEWRGTRDDKFCELEGGHKRKSLHATVLYHTWLHCLWWQPSSWALFLRLSGGNWTMLTISPAINRVVCPLY